MTDESNSHMTDTIVTHADGQIWRAITHYGNIFISSEGFFPYSYSKHPTTIITIITIENRCVQFIISHILSLQFRGRFKLRHTHMEMEIPKHVELKSSRDGHPQ